MDMHFDTSLTEGYKSPSQIARILTEAWVTKNMFCPKCGQSYIRHFENNRPVADFYCEKCNSQFELKSKNGAFGRVIADGAYDTMMARITHNSTPDFMFMNYSQSSQAVTDFIFVPKHFFVPSVIEKRKPLSETARRAGWVGCNILFDKIPVQGRIPIITNGIAENIGNTVYLVQKAERLKTDSPDSQGWLYDVLNCVNAIPKNDFVTDDVYRYETLLQRLHPNNHNIRAKIRQQLQFLRDAGFIEVSERGHYGKKDRKENVSSDC